MYRDLLSGRPLSREELPRTASGIVSFFSPEQESSSKMSIDSWDGLYRMREKPHQNGVQQGITVENRMRNWTRKPFFLRLLACAEDLSKGAQTLEAGCGTALTSALVSMKFDLTAYGFDVSPTAISGARRMFSECGLDIDLVSVADVVKLPYPDNAFDLVFGKTVFEHFEDPNKAACELARVTAHGGTLLLDVPNANNARWTLHSEAAHGHTHTTRTYSIEALSDLLTKAGFAITDSWGDALFYTTPYILLKTWWLRFGNRGSGTDSHSSVERPPVASGQRTRLLSPLLGMAEIGDRCFKRVCLSLNRFAQSAGLVNPHNGVLVGVVARKVQ